MPKIKNEEYLFLIAMSGKPEIFASSYTPVRTKIGSRGSGKYCQEDHVLRDNGDSY